MPNKSAQNRSYLSISEAAEYLGINPMTLRRWDKSGKLTSYKTKGQHRRYRLKDLEALAAKRNFQLPYGSIQQVIEEHPSQEVEPKVIQDAEEKEHARDHLFSEYEPPPLPPQSFPKLRYAAFIAVFLLLVASALSFAAFIGNPASDYFSFLNSYNNNLAEQKSENNTLADTSVTAQMDQSRNVLAARTGDSLLTVNTDTRINGLLEALGGINTYGEDADLGEGELTASNVIYSIIAGDGIEVSSGQNPTITNTDLGSDQNIFGNVVVGSTTISATTNTDTLTLKSGGSVSLSTSGKEITISATDTDTDTTYTAGSDLDLTGTVFSLETALDTVTTINLAGTGTITGVDSFTAADGGIIDLSAILHDDSAVQGLKLPQNVTASLVSIVGGGEGYLAWSTDENKLKQFDGTSWADIATGGSTLWTDAGGYIYADNATNVVITDTNTIGIGTTSPAYALDVRGTGRFTELLTLNSGVNINSETFTDLTGNGLTLDSGSLALNLTTGAGTGVTASGSGLEFSSGTVGLLQGCSDNELLQWNESNLTWECQSVTGAGAVTGTGVTNYLARWTNSTNLSTGLVYDTGTFVGIGTTSPSTLLDLAGRITFTSAGVQTFTDRSFLDLGNIVHGTTEPQGLRLPNATTANLTLNEPSSGEG
ncbi:MAG: helix-turn-helix domain-containing protein, partial [Candidatus Roizmanbacteria bacterium]|nr:helix-turn-helix domain-containing protein [Candidatus Roizmanbacteria bacterium]